MSGMKFALAVVLATVLVSSGCGSDVRLLSVQVIPADPNLAHNTSFYIAPGSSIQFLIQGWYSNRTVQTIASGKWSSTNTSVATVNGNGLATSVGPVGVSAIVVDVDGHTSSVVLGVCDPTVVVCPPPPG
jgi:hypothetical protein